MQYDLDTNPIKISNKPRDQPLFNLDEKSILGLTLVLS